MKSGAQAIVQASLGSGDWRGRADVLLRVDQIEKPSRLGNWSYELVDCKLARQTKAETILQLCLYSELVTELQGLQPELFHVIRPNVGFQPESYRLSAFAAYYRVVTGPSPCYWGLKVGIRSRACPLFQGSSLQDCGQPSRARARGRDFGSNSVA
jgi:hypothetical protein